MAQTMIKAQIANQSLNAWAAEHLIKNAEQEFKSLFEESGFPA